MQAEPSKLNSYEWTHANWKADLQRFRKERAEVEGAVKGGGKPAAIASKYRALFLRNKKDLAALFRWGYALFEQYSQNPYHLPDTHQDLMKEFTLLGPVDAYEFARMQVMIVLALGFEHPKVLTLSDALAEYNPKDYKLRSTLVMRTHVLTPESRKKCLGYANDMLRLEPNRAFSYGNLGSVYFRIWITDKEKDIEVLKKSIYYYEERLKRDSRDNQATRDTRRLLGKLKAKFAALEARKP